MLAAALLFAWARFVEPALILVHEHRAQIGFPARIALISDLHLGVYKRAAFLERLVERLNALDVEVVLIAGDLTQFRDRPLRELFAPLGKLRHRAFAVRGNHDDDVPEHEMREALATAGVTLLENQATQLERFLLVGLGDHSTGSGRPEMLDRFRGAGSVVVLAHNPDATSLFPPGIATVTFTGHTHGGQIRIPWIYRLAIPTRGSFDRDWHDVPNTRLFVTSGVGENGLPLRFLVPPVIDVIVLE